MNRYPLWKYAIMLVALLVGLVYTLPNLFGEAPAVQVSSGKVTVKLDASLASRIEDILGKAGAQARLRAATTATRSRPASPTWTRSERPRTRSAPR